MISTFLMAHSLDQHRTLSALSACMQNGAKTIQSSYVVPDRRLDADSLHASLALIALPPAPSQPASVSMPSLSQLGLGLSNPAHTIQELAATEHAQDEQQPYAIARPGKRFREPWTQQEDTLLEAAIEKHQQSSRCHWVAILNDPEFALLARRSAEELKGRCRVNKKI
jgi:hypothetical protein